MNLLQESLYWITSGLLVPCIVFLLFMLTRCLLEVGQYLAHKKNQSSAIDSLDKWAQTSSLMSAEIADNAKNLVSFTTLTAILTTNDLALNRLNVSRFESEIEQRLTRYSNFAKFGPIAGLVGTLIPMGPALKGLADGDIQALAGQMQIAFTTTVIGLIVGAIGLTLYQMHKRHYFKQLALLDFVLEKQEASNGK